jgi:hypothetical protein
MATTLLKDKILNHLNNIKSTKLKQESLITSIKSPKHLKNWLQINRKTQSHKNQNLKNFRRKDKNHKKMTNTKLLSSNPRYKNREQKNKASIKTTISTELRVKYSILTGHKIHLKTEKSRSLYMLLINKFKLIDQ